MTTKSKLIEKINDINDDNYLKALLSYLEASEKSPVELSHSDIQSIEKSEEQLRNGQFLTQDELRFRINECF